MLRHDASVGKAMLQQHKKLKQSRRLFDITFHTQKLGFTLVLARLTCSPRARLLVEETFESCVGWSQLMPQIGSVSFISKCVYRRFHACRLDELVAINGSLLIPIDMEAFPALVSQLVNLTRPLTLTFAKTPGRAAAFRKQLRRRRHIASESQTGKDPELASMPAAGRATSDPDALCENSAESSDGALLTRPIRDSTARIIEVSRQNKSIESPANLVVADHSDTTDYALAAAVDRSPLWQNNQVVPDVCAVLYKVPSCMKIQDQESPPSEQSTVAQAAWSDDDVSPNRPTLVSAVDDTAVRHESRAEAEQVSSLWSNRIVPDGARKQRPPPLARIFGSKGLSAGEAKPRARCSRDVQPRKVDDKRILSSCVSVRKPQILATNLQRSAADAVDSNAVAHVVEAKAPFSQHVQADLESDRFCDVEGSETGTSDLEGRLDNTSPIRLCSDQDATRDPHATNSPAHKIHTTRQTSNNSSGCSFCGCTRFFDYNENACSCMCFDLPDHRSQTSDIISGSRAKRF